MARYSVLRLMIFFGLLCALWLLGLRDPSQRWWLLGLSAVGSMVVSFFVLREPRAQFSASIVQHLDDRAERAEQTRPPEIDEHAEDSEASGGPRA
ncbi:MAG TPA: DUF4229 domain-containing protein [Dermatophilaceae bacterium]|nr:DUF4229 domain-containing protein [Dermatophilaceae bacterium]